jgi:hypothetical protein
LAIASTTNLGFYDSMEASVERRNEWKGEINRAEGHMHRAAYLAAERISGMSYLLTNEHVRSRC